MAKFIVKLPASLKQFMSIRQRNAVVTACNSEEKDFFVDKMQELSKTFGTMPKTYEQDGKGDQAVAYLHYFKGGMDWYITERDMEDEQLQAFGIANLGHGFELGYISIDELMKNQIELDFHWTPKTVGEIKAGI